MIQKMWCLMLQLSNNMWFDSPDSLTFTEDQKPEVSLGCDKKVWDEIMEFAAANGCNSVLIDLGDGVRYQSHPEIAIEGSWEPNFLKKELQRLRDMGLTPYPKLNFSASHDAWLKQYSKMLSTDIYYNVCKDIIYEVIDLFDNPEFFHLGMDEEYAEAQTDWDFACARQNNLIWHDLKFLLGCVREKGVRPWIWADYYWSHPEEFLKNVGKDVLVSPWYYGHFYPIKSTPMPSDDYNVARINSFRNLSEAGYDVIPGGSNYNNTFNFEHMTRFSLENIKPEHYRGILNIPWKKTTDRYKYRILDAIHLANYAKEEFGQ